jgi:hypothetical protein
MSVGWHEEYERGSGDFERARLIMTIWQEYTVLHKSASENALVVMYRQSTFVICDARHAVNSVRIADETLAWLRLQHNVTVMWKLEDIGQSNTSNTVK